MLRSITVENYRGFRQKTTVNLRPLTILLGRNSSGKSSLTRLIPLFQQSFDRQSSSPLLWSSDSVDLGNISDVITHSQHEEELRIGVKTAVPYLFSYLSRRSPRFIRPQDNENFEIEYTIRLSADGNRTRFNGIDIGIEGQLLVIDWDRDGFVSKIMIDSTDYPVGSGDYIADTKSFFPNISRSIAKEDIDRSLRTNLFYDPLRTALAEVIHGRTAKEKIDFSRRLFRTRLAGR